MENSVLRKSPWCMPAQTREVVDAMRADAGTELKLLRVDGGCSRNGLLLQLQSDTLQAITSASACRC